MDIGTALRLRLQQDAGVAAIFATRIYPIHLPPAPIYPAVTYQIVSAVPLYSHDGPCHLVDGRVQFDVYAATHQQMADAVKALRVPLDGWRGTIGTPPKDIQAVFWINEFDWPVPETERAGPSLYRKTLECNSWFAED